MFLARNLALHKHMQEAQVNQAELARLVNTEIEKFTGKLGTVSERTVQNWLSGTSKWPPSRCARLLREYSGVLVQTSDSSHPVAAGPQHRRTP